MPDPTPPDTGRTPSTSDRRRHLTQAYRREVSAARLRVASDPAAAWRNLERAHILSQPMARLHVGAHTRMLGWAIKHRDRAEVTGQLLRLAVAGPASALRRYPTGNTGSAGVRATAPMDIPDDVRPLLAPFDQDRK